MSQYLKMKYDEARLPPDMENSGTPITNLFEYMQTGNIVILQWKDIPQVLK